MKRRLLIISGAINYGSSGRIVEPVGLLAEKNGYEVLVAHSSKNANSNQLCHSLLHLNGKSENTLWVQRIRSSCTFN